MNISGAGGDNGYIKDIYSFIYRTEDVEKDKFRTEQNTEILPSLKV